MASRSKPRCGSVAYSPRKRSKKQTPRMHAWPSSDQASLLGFAGYKAGMTHVIAQDNRPKSPTSGLEVFMPATVIDTPPLIIAGLRAYVKGYEGKKTLIDIYSKELPKNIEKSLPVSKEKNPEKELDELSKNESLVDVTALVCTQPSQTSIPKNKPDVMEIAVGGGLSDKISYLKDNLGKTVSVRDVFSENNFVDVCAVTKGKGFQGPIKRWGISIQPRKATKGRRHGGTGGAWTPKKKMWMEPQAGQMGYHTRTEYNKTLLRVGDKGEDVTPNGGFLSYGLVKGEYVLLSGSVPGPAKRIIRINQPRRPAGSTAFDVTYISTESKQGV